MQGIGMKLRRPSEGQQARLSVSWPLVAIVFVSFALRAACAIHFTGMIDTEGAEYARIAQNLLAGVGYVGIATEGQQLFFPPLFPFLIAAVSLLTGDAEVAGRIVSVVMGSLLVVPVYLIARRMYNERIAIVGAALVGAHPLLVQFSTTVHCEPTYLTLVLTAIYMAMRAMDSPTPRNLFIMGGFYGLAYLVRPEALLYMLVGTGFLALQIALDGGRHWVDLLGQSLLIMLGFLLLAGPYIVWLSVQTGQLRVEGKSPLNIPTMSRVQQGQSFDEAAFGIDPDLTLRGVWIQPNLTTISAPSVDITALATLLEQRLKPVLKNSFKRLTNNRHFGSPALFALTILGLFARPWSSRLAVDQLHIATILGLVIFGMLFFYDTSGDQFYLLFLPFFCIWAGLGVVRFSQWASRSAANFGLGQVFHRSIIGAASGVLALTAIILPSAASLASKLTYYRAERDIKEASVSLFALRSKPIRIADVSTPVAFHARADFIWLPYCDEATALRFLAKSGVTHVVLRDQGLDARPYLKKWMEHDVPNARQILAMVSATGERFRIYELER